MIDHRQRDRVQVHGRSTAKARVRHPQPIDQYHRRQVPDGHVRLAKPAVVDGLADVAAARKCRAESFQHREHVLLSALVDRSRGNRLDRSDPHRFRRRDVRACYDNGLHNSRIRILRLCGHDAKQGTDQGSQETSVYM